MNVIGLFEENLTSHLSSLLLYPTAWVFSNQLNLTGNAPWGYVSNSALISSFSYPSFFTLNAITDSIPKGTIGNINSLLSKYNLGKSPSPSSFIIFVVWFPSSSVTFKVIWVLYSFCALGAKVNCKVTNPSWLGDITPLVDPTSNIASVSQFSGKINFQSNFLSGWTLAIFISFDLKFFWFSYMNVLGNLTTMSLIVIAESIFLARICLFNPV